MLTNSSLYNYSDSIVPTTDFFYYRLKMIDVDGKFSYSNTIRIQTKGSSDLLITGNPVGNNLNVTGLKNTGTIKISDLSGKLVLVKNIQSQSVSINISFLQNGIYILSYFNGFKTETIKFVKQ